MNVIVILIVIIVLALVLYGASYFLKKKHYHKIDELENRKLSLTEIPVIDEINKLKKLQLTGQTEKSFKDWAKFGVISPLFIFQILKTIYLMRSKQLTV